MIRRKSSEVLNCLSLTQILSKLNITCCYCSLHTFEKQGWKGFRTKAWDGYFIEFRTQMAVELFKNFDQNSGWKCSCSWLKNSHGILQEFRSEYWWETLVANNLMILEFFIHFDQNSFKMFWRIMQPFVFTCRKSWYK